MSADSGRVEGARRATVLRYGGSLWVNGYWPDTILSIELRPVQRATGRVVLVGPPSASGSAIVVELGATGSLEAYARELADWLETPALAVSRAEHVWPEVARSVVAELADGGFEEVPA